MKEKQNLFYKTYSFSRTSESIDLFMSKLNVWVKVIFLSTKSFFSKSFFSKSFFSNLRNKKYLIYLNFIKPKAFDLNLLQIEFFFELIFNLF